MSDVHVGLDGWLFLTGGTNSVVDLYSNEAEFPDETANKWADELIRRKTLADELGAQFLHVIAPEKLVVYREFATLPLPSPLHYPAERVGKKLHEKGYSDILLYPLEILRQASLKEQVYFKSDTHWTYAGILYVYEELCKKLFIKPKDFIKNRETLTYNALMDLGGKLVPPIYEEILHVPFLPGIERIYANKVAALWDEAAANSTPVLIHGSLHVIYRNNRPDSVDKKVVMFGDSFFDFRESTFSSTIIEQFREVHTIWSNSMDTDYVREIRPDILLTENAERFMRWAPSQQYNIKAETAMRLKELGLSD